MIRTHIFPCALPKPEGDALNQESGRIYTRVMVNHYRAFRQSGATWLSMYGAQKLDDYYGATGSPLLHSHSIDAAQEAFYKACKIARVNRGEGAHFPHKRKPWRSTIWKNTGIRGREGYLLLARAKGREPIRVDLPSHLVALPSNVLVEMRLVWDNAARHYTWHLVVDDGHPDAEPPGHAVMAGDLGEIHPITLTDGHTATVISARALRAVRQRTNKRLAEIQAVQSRRTKASCQWRKLQRRKNRFLAQQARRVRDIEHKVSRAAVDIAIAQQVGTLALGDVREVADGKRLNSKSQQKVANWSHGRLRQYITYKAKSVGILVELVDEHYTSQTCPSCGARHKPKGRRYRCPACGFVAHRDVVGAANILSRHTTGELSRVFPPEREKYRHPFCNRKTGKRSPVGTGQVAWQANHRATQEAAPLQGQRSATG